MNVDDVPSKSENHNNRIMDSVHGVAELMARRRAKEEEKKAWWARYKEQLAKSVPNQGGAHHSTNNTRAFRIW